MTRLGQFDEGEHTLMVGIDEKTLLSCKHKHFKLRLGNTEYREPVERLREARHTIWKNKRGKRVRITPVSEFNENTKSKTNSIKEEGRQDTPTKQEPGDTMSTLWES